MNYDDGQGYEDCPVLLKNMRISEELPGFSQRKQCEINLCSFSCGGHPLWRKPNHNDAKHYEALIYSITWVVSYTTNFLFQSFSVLYIYFIMMFTSWTRNKQNFVCVVTKMMATTVTFFFCFKTIPMASHRWQNAT